MKKPEDVFVDEAYSLHLVIGPNGLEPDCAVCKAILELPHEFRFEPIIDNGFVVTPVLVPESFLRRLEEAGISECCCPSCYGAVRDLL